MRQRRQHEGGGGCQTAGGERVEKEMFINRRVAKNYLTKAEWRQVMI